MSAIAAIVRLDGHPVETSLIETVLDRLSHRGDDGRGSWSGGNAGLGHQMRWTTPESLKEKLPRREAAAGAVITFDGRIDNREDLLRTLGSNGVAADELPDSEIVLRAYEKWGRECPAHLIGDFVFAIWNERDKTLFAARDPLGVKHFYYFHQPGKLFALASEVKALLAVDGIPQELDEVRLGDYLVANSEDKEGTFYKGIYRLPPTHALLLDGSNFRIWEYWKPSDEELRLKKDSDYHEMFREKFTDAVAARLRSAFPVGSMLSGGLDSSSIVCVGSKFLKENGGPPLHAFSAIFPSVAELDSRIDERRFMQSVIEATGCSAHMITADNESPFADIDKVLWHTDHPVGAPMYLDWQIFKAAKSAGVRVVLSGFDGDSTVSHGYEDLARLARRGRYYRLLRDSIGLKRNMPRRNHTLKKLVWRNGILRSLPPWTFQAWRKVRGRDSSDHASSVIFPLHVESVRSEFRKAHDLEGRIEQLREKNYPEGLSSIGYHWRALTNGYFCEVLENLEKASAAFEIEPRFPFFDRRLIEFCIALPPGQRIFGGWTRSIFRHAMAGSVPDDVVWRTDKSNIGASVKVNMLKYGSDQLESLFGPRSSRLAEYLDLRSLTSAYDRYRRDPMGRESEALLLLTTVYLSNWLSQSGFERGQRESTAAAIAV